MKQRFFIEFSNNRDELAKVFAQASDIFHAFGGVDSQTVKKILKRLFSFLLQ